MEKNLAIGIDIGASHIGSGIVNIKTGEIIHKHYLMVNVKGKEKLLIDSLIKCIEKLLNMSSLKINDIIKIGIGCPGDCDIENGEIIIAPNLKLENVAIKEKIQKIYNIPVNIQNDATCALLGEYYFGALKNIKNNVMFITFGSGVGFAGINCKEKIIDIRVCNKWASIFRKEYNEEKIAHNSGSLSQLQEEYSNAKIMSISRKQIFIDAKNKEKIAIDILEKYINNISRGINKLHKETEYSCFCIGGGLSEHKKLFFNKLKDNLPELQIYIADNKNDSAIIGAAMLNN